MIWGYPCFGKPPYAVKLGNWGWWEKSMSWESLWHKQHDGLTHVSGTAYLNMLIWMDCSNTPSMGATIPILQVCFFAWEVGGLDWVYCTACTCNTKVERVFCLFACLFVGEQRTLRGCWRSHGESQTNLCVCACMCVFTCLFGISAQKGHCSQTYAPGKLQQRCANTCKTIN